MVNHGIIILFMCTMKYILVLKKQKGLIGIRFLPSVQSPTKLHLILNDWLNLLTNELTTFLFKLNKLDIQYNIILFV